MSILGSFIWLPLGRGMHQFIPSDVLVRHKYGVEFRQVVSDTHLYFECKHKDMTAIRLLLGNLRI